MQYSFVPQKVMEKQPIYDKNPTCPICWSTDSFPTMNMYGSSRRCNRCQHIFPHKIVGYKNVIVEKDLNM